MTTAAYLYLGAILFAVGALGTLLTTRAVDRLVGVELMLAAAILTFAASAVGFRELEGQLAALLVVGVAIAQATVGSALVSRARRPE
jgi:NADH:ubiquinone oxidoreductase subunit K